MERAGACTQHKVTHPREPPRHSAANEENAVVISMTEKYLGPLTRLKSLPDCHSAPVLGLGSRKRQVVY